MKRPVLWMSLLGLLCGSLAFGQGKVDPVLVGNVRTDYFESIVMDADTLRYSDTVPTSRMWLSVQHAFDSVDVALRRGPFLLTSDWLFLDPDTNTVQSVFDWIDLNWRGSGGFLTSYSTAASTAFDLENLHAYLLGGTYYTNYFMTVVTNDSGTNYVFRRDEDSGVEMSTDGGGENPALVPALQYGQGTTQTNFMKVNTNTYLTTNIFLKILLEGLELEDYADPPDANSSPGYIDRHAAYTNLMALVSAYEWMGTNYVDLPTDLSFTFPGLFSGLSDWLLQLDEKFEEDSSGIREIVFLEDVAGVFTVDWTNGLSQAVVITNDNMEVSFAAPPLGVDAEFKLWLQNALYTNVVFTGAYIGDTNAVDPSSKELEWLSCYHANPFQSYWVEEAVYPSVYIEPGPPALSEVAVTFGTGSSTFRVDTNTYYVGTNYYRTYTLYSSSATSGATGSFELDGAGVFDVLVCGGGGGGGNYYGGGGGGGVVGYYPAVTLEDIPYTATIGAGGARTVSGGETALNTIYTAAGGAAGATGGVHAQPGGNGGASGTASGGARSDYAGGGGAAAGTVAGGHSSSPYPAASRGGDGAQGYYSTIIDAGVRRFGSGGGGGTWANSTSSAGSGGWGAGRGGWNQGGGLAATSYGGGGGGGGTKDAPLGAAGYSGCIVLRQSIAAP